MTSDHARQVERVGGAEGRAQGRPVHAPEEEGEQADGEERPDQRGADARDDITPDSVQSLLTH